MCVYASNMNAACIHAMHEYISTFMQTDTQKCQTDAEKQKAILIWSGSANAPSPIPAKVRAVNRLGMGNGGGTWLTHKDRLALSLRVGGQVALAPLTFTLPRERPALQRHCDEQSGGQTIWIVKLARNGRSRGTYVTRTIGSISGGGDCVVCQYIERPLLVHGHKHDLRLYVIVFPSSPARSFSQSFIHTGGYVRFAAKEFSLADLETGDTWDPFVHLTYLDSVDRLQHRIQREKEWTVKDYFKYLGEQPEYGPEQSAGLWKAIKELARRSIGCLPQSLLLREEDSREGDVGPSAFELFGFDVLVDADLRPWLLEVNGQPHLGSSSKNGASVFVAEHEAKSAVVAGTLTLALADPAADLHHVAQDVGFESLAVHDPVGNCWWKQASLPGQTYESQST